MILRHLCRAWFASVWLCNMPHMCGVASSVSSVSSVSSSGASISCCLFACRFGRIAVSFGLGNDVAKGKSYKFQLFCKNCAIKSKRRLPAQISVNSQRKWAQHCVKIGRALCWYKDSLLAQCPVDMYMEICIYLIISSDVTHSENFVYLWCHVKDMTKTSAHVVYVRR